MFVVEDVWWKNLAFPSFKISQEMSMMRGVIAFLSFSPFHFKAQAWSTNP
jgi:hypothetical protein